MKKIYVRICVYGHLKLTLNQSIVFSPNKHLVFIETIETILVHCQKRTYKVTNIQKERVGELSWVHSMELNKPQLHNLSMNNEA